MGLVTVGAAAVGAAPSATFTVRAARKRTSNILFSFFFFAKLFLSGFSYNFNLMKIKMSTDFKKRIPNSEINI